MAAFDWLQQRGALSENVFARSVLQQGMTFRDERVSLMSPQGIFKPAQLELPLSIATTADSPYSDSFGPDGFVRYSYRGTNPEHRDNVILREASKNAVPLIYFHAIVPGQYLAIWPIFIVGDDRANLKFTVALDDVTEVRRRLEAGALGAMSEESSSIRRQYLTRTVLYRVHQQEFRERVLQAYQVKCALCRLRHRELLDAAHIVPDSLPEGEPKASNGISLCKLHHAAYDAFFIGVRPDYTVVVNSRVLREQDGPMLLHGLQGVHNSVISVPRARIERPDPNLLQLRYSLFQERNEAA